MKKTISFILAALIFMLMPGILSPMSAGASEPDYVIDVDFSEFKDGELLSNVAAKYPGILASTFNIAQPSYSTANTRFEILGGAMQATAIVPIASGSAGGGFTLTLPNPKPNKGRYYVETEFSLGDTNKQFQFAMASQTGGTSLPSGTPTAMIAQTVAGGSSPSITYANSGWGDPAPPQPGGAVSPSTTLATNTSFVFRHLVNLDERYFDGFWMSSNNGALEQYKFGGSSRFPYRYYKIVSAESKYSPVINTISMSGANNGAANAGDMLYSIKRIRVWAESESVGTEGNKITEISNYPNVSADNVANKIYAIMRGAKAADIFDNAVIDPSATKRLLNAGGEDITGQKDSTYLWGGEKIKVTDADGNDRLYTLAVRSDVLFKYNFDQGKTKQEMMERDNDKGYWLITSANRAIVTSSAPKDENSPETQGYGLAAFARQTFPGVTLQQWFVSATSPAGGAGIYVAADTVGVKTDRSAMFAIDNTAASGNTRLCSMLTIKDVQTQEGKKKYVLSVDVRPGKDTKTIVNLLGGNANSGDGDTGGLLRNNILVGVAFDNRARGKTGTISIVNGARGSEDNTDNRTDKFFCPDSWHQVSLVVDIDAEEASVFVNGELVRVISISENMEKWKVGEGIHLDLNPVNMSLAMEQLPLSGNVLSTASYFDNLSVYEVDSPANVYPNTNCNYYKPIFDGIGAVADNCAGVIKLAGDESTLTAQELLDAAVNLPVDWIAGVYNNAETTVLDADALLYTVDAPNKLILKRGETIKSYCITADSDYEFGNDLGWDSTLATGINKVKLLNTDVIGGTFIIALYNQGALKFVDVRDITSGMSDANRTLECNIPTDANLADYELKCFVFEKETVKPLIGEFRK